MSADSLVIAGKTYGSRLLVGTGKYKDFAQTRAAVVASGAQIVTVAIRRTNIGQDPNQPSLLDALPPGEFTYLPNTAGCYSADEAVRTLRLARELLEGHDLVKLEVLGDKESLFPNMPETLKAAEILVKDGFKVMVYCSDDPIQARMLEDIGCVAVMPLASLIGNCIRLNLCFARIGRLAWITAPSEAYLLFRNGLVASNTATGISACAIASAAARFLMDSDLFMILLW